ncbi:UNVERIFIED_CONTAM: Transcription factor GTE1 [Sesamum angustifolium]|uniref:Transcription factor GTE1 n=1 Tax=Sesamum angustifolium TaxID=2727405 RepID=A0AAW2PS64_9LAMI
MDLVNASNDALTNLGETMVEGNAAQEDDYKNKLMSYLQRLTKPAGSFDVFNPCKLKWLEQRVNEVEQFYVKLKEPNTSRNASITKDKEKKHIPSMKKLQQDASRREAAAAKRMQELMRQFGSIFRQEKRREEEEAEAQTNMQLAQEAAHAKLAREINNELYDIDMHIEELREMVVKKCRICVSNMCFSTWLSSLLLACQLWSTKVPTLLYFYLHKSMLYVTILLQTHIYNGEKKARIALSNLCPEDLSKALDIVAQNNLNFPATAEEVELDINAQVHISTLTLPVVDLCTF